MIAMNFLSHELCVQLKDAGFPQPKPDVGQFWYRVRYPDGEARHSVLCVITKRGLTPLDGLNSEFGDSDWVYCPTIEDILREMPIECGIFRVDTPLGVKWMCVELEGGDVDLKALRDTPVKAAVMKWGKIKMRNS